MAHWNKTSSVPIPVMRLNLTSNSGQALWLAIANFVSFSFGIVSAAILSRFLSVEEYGSYKQVLYIYSTLLTVFTLGLPRAYSFFLARLPIEEGKSAVNRINGIFLLLGTVFSLTLLFGSSIIASILKNPDLTILLKWFSPTPLFLLPVMGLESIMATYRKASYATIYVVLSRLFTLACVVIPVLIWGGPKAAVIGFSVASILSFIVGIVLERKPFKGVSKNKSSLRLREVIIYSLPLLFINLTSILEKAAPQFYISRYWGVSEFAEFSNGYIELPFATMVIGAVSTVLLPLFSRLSNSVIETKEIIRLWNSSFEKSVEVIYPLSIFCLFFAKEIITFLYGNNYTDAVIYFQIIIISTLTRIVPYGPIIMALNKNRQYLLIQSLTTVAVWSACGAYIIIGGNNPYVIAIIATIITILYLFSLLVIVSNSLKVKIKQLIPFVMIFKTLALSCISCFMAFIILYNLNLNSFMSIIVGACIFFICFVTFSLIFNIPNYIINNLLHKLKNL